MNTHRSTHALHPGTGVDQKNENKTNERVNSLLEKPEEKKGIGNIQYQNYLNSPDGVLFSKSSSQLDELRELVLLGKHRNEPLLLIVRDEEIKKVIQAYVQQLGNTGIIFIETIDTIRKGIHSDSLNNGIISFFDIPNFGKNTKHERDLISYIQESCPSIKLLFSNFSDKYKSNIPLRDTLRENIVIDNNGSDVKSMNEDPNNGKLKLIESPIKQTKETKDFLQETLGTVNSKPLLGITDSIEQSKGLRNECDSTLVLSQNNISQYISNPKKIKDYDMVVLHDHLLGYFDISIFENIILLNYLSLDKVRKVAKQLIKGQKGKEKTIYSQMYPIPYKDQDNPLSNTWDGKIQADEKIAWDNNRAIPRIPNNKPPKIPITNALEKRLGITPETDIKRLDSELLIDNLKKEFQSLKVHEINFWLGNIKDIKTGLSNNNVFKEYRSRKKRSMDSYNRSELLTLFHELGIMEGNKINLKDFITHSFINIDSSDITLITQEFLGHEYKDLIIKGVKQEFKESGIESFFDLLFYGYKMKKPDSFPIKDFNQSNKEDTSSLIHLLRGKTALHLMILLFAEDAHASSFKAKDIEKLGRALFTENEIVSAEQVFIFNVRNDIKKILSNSNKTTQKNNKISDFVPKNIDTSSIDKILKLLSQFYNSSSDDLRKNISQYPYLNLYKKRLKIGHITKEAISKISEKLVGYSLENEINKEYSPKKIS